MNEAYDEGFRAYFMGADCGENPYNRNKEMYHIAYSDWERGWHAAYVKVYGK